MATQYQLVCPTDADLDRAAKAIEEEMAQNFKGISDLIDSLDTATPTKDIDAALAVLDQIVNLGGDTLDNLSDRTGMPPSQPTQLQDEQRLALLGIALINGIAWKLDGLLNNIEPIRRLYFALGSDKNKLLEILSRTSDDFVIVHSKQNYIVLPNKKNGIAYTLEEIRTLLKNNSIQSNDIIKQDSKTVIRTLSFISADTSIKTASKIGNTPEYNIITTVFHINEITDNSKTLNRYQNYGITDERLTSALFGEDLENFGQTKIEELIVSSKRKVARLTKLLGFLIDRFKIQTKESLNKTSADIGVISTDARKDLNTAQSMVNFKVVAIPDKKVYEKLTTKNSKDDFFYLLEKRTDITGIDFSFTDTQMQDLINSALTVKAGTPTLSAIKVNQTSTTDSQVANNIYKMQTKLTCIETNNKSPFTVLKLQAAKTCAEEYQLIFPYQDLLVQDTNLIGQTCYDSPATQLGMRLNFNATWNIDNQIQAVMDMLGISAISAALSAIIKWILKIAKSARQKADELINKMRQKILPWQQKYEALQSKYGSLVGGGSFDSSLIKCAVGFEMELASGLFDLLEELLKRLETLINNLINEILETLADLLEKILCYPIVLIENLLNKLNSQLPTFCKIMAIALPQDLEDALMELRRAIGMYGNVFGPLQSNLLIGKAAITNNLSKLAAFRQSAACATQATNSFFNTSLFSTGFSVGPAGLSTATEALPPNALGALGKIGSLL